MKVKTMQKVLAMALAAVMSASLLTENRISKYSVTDIVKNYKLAEAYHKSEHRHYNTPDTVGLFLKVSFLSCGLLVSLALAFFHTEGFYNTDTRKNIVKRGVCL